VGLFLREFYQGKLEEFGIDRKVEDIREIADFVNEATGKAESTFSAKIATSFDKASWSVKPLFSFTKAR